MEDAQGWETDPDLFTLKDEDYSSFERVLKGIRESIFTAITIPKEQLTSYGSSFYNMEANAQAFRKRLQSLVDEAKIVDFVIHGTWKTQSYKPASPTTCVTRVHENATEPGPDRRHN
jgi:phage-related protein